MSIENIRKAIRERLEEIYKANSEFQYNLSKVVIPFSEFFKKSESVDDEKEFSSESKEEYKKLLMQELKVNLK
jgi:predicted ATP-dependent endonuclease of OLD family